MTAATTADKLLFVPRSLYDALSCPDWSVQCPSVAARSACIMSPSSDGGIDFQPPPHSPLLLHPWPPAPSLKLFSSRTN